MGEEIGRKLLVLEVSSMVDTKEVSITKLKPTLIPCLKKWNNKKIRMREKWID